jgi:hypothetical protein
MAIPETVSRRERLIVRTLTCAALAVLLACSVTAAAQDELVEDESSDPLAPSRERDGVRADERQRAEESESESESESEGESDSESESESVRSGIDGVVVDASTRETMIEAPVIVVGRGTRVLTDYDGLFSLDLRPGTYVLRSYYDYYQPARVEDIVVRAGERTTVEIALVPETGMEAEEVVIEVRAESGTAESQLRVRRESTAVQDSIGAEEMARTPDSTAADSARRTVGVSILDDYLYVRGLGGRYVATLLNGVQLPSTDPDIPGVQLDIFPVGLLESLTIRKTYTADMPGDWAGGIMDISTADYPTTFRLRLSLSLGMNSDVTFRDGLGYRGGDLDFLGTDDGTRHMPDVPAQRVDAGASGLTEAEADEISERFPNTWALTRRTVLPNLTLGATMGDTVDLGGHLFGYLLSFGYRYTEGPGPDYVASVQRGEGGLRIRESLTQQPIRRRIQLGGLGTATLELAPDHRATIVGLFSQNAEDFTGRLEGTSETDGNMPIRATRFSWTQRTLAFAQLLGDHGPTDGLHFHWQGNVSYGNRYQPDLRDMAYRQNPRGDWVWLDRSGSGERFYSSLVDLNYGAGGDLTIPVDQLEFQIGGLLRQTERRFDTRRFAWQYQGGESPEGRLLNAQELFSQESIARYTTLAERTRVDDSYDGLQSLAAAYLTAQWEPISALRLVAGVRGEGFRQVVVSSSPFETAQGTQAPSTHRTDIDGMPSVALAWEMAPSMFLRASYGGTVARPQLRELAPFLFQDFQRRRTIAGNPQLLRTYIHNFDVRWEWFPGAEDVLAVSLFAKVFENPIESVILDSEGNISFDNAAGADDVGGEVEGRLNLGHLTPELSFLSVGANVTLVWSRARLTADQLMNATSPERPLAGQAPFVVNLSLGVTPPDSGLSINLYYNVLGPRLEDVGRNTLPDIYREPFHALDLAVTWQPDPHLLLRLNATNILHQRQLVTQGGLPIQGFDPGTTISIGAGYQY